MADLINKIQKSFAVQAEKFEGKEMIFSKQEYLEYTINSVEVQPTDSVLEVASGTCVTGRALAPYAKKVVCIDATEEMLNVGRREAENNGLSNMEFLIGLAEQLPFEDNTFDVVITRLSFHHFADMERPFAEMNRVLKKGGKLVIIDMQATQEFLREIEDEIETLRDFSHVKNRSKDEFIELFEQYDYHLVKQEYTAIPVKLSAWMDLTKTPEEIKEKITKLMEDELSGGDKTGFFPYKHNEEIYFSQRWLFLLGVK